MNKKLIKLTESDLHKIVKESVNKILNEAYGTPDAKTQKEVDYMRGHSMENYEPLKELMRNLRNSVHNFKQDVHWYMAGGENFQKPIKTACDEFLKKIDSIFELYGNKLIQLQGEQPDAKYNERHNGNDTTSGGWTRGPEPYHTRGY